MTGADQLTQMLTLNEQNNGCVLDKLARGEYDMNKIKSKEFLYPIDGGRLMGDPFFFFSKGS